MTDIREDRMIEHLSINTAVPEAQLTAIVMEAKNIAGLLDAIKAASPMGQSSEFRDDIKQRFDAGLIQQLNALRVKAGLQELKAA